MHRSLTLLATLWFALTAFLPVSGAQGQAVTVKSKAPANVSEEKPRYLQFKEATVTRLTKTKYAFDVTLWDKIKGNTTDKIVFYVGYDIDDNASTGDTSAASPSFGQDIGVFIVKAVGSNRFTAFPEQKKVLGKLEEMKISNLKVNGDKLTFEIRSDLFGDFDRYKFFLSSQIIRYERGKEMSNIQVDTLSSNGGVTFGPADSK